MEKMIGIIIQARINSSRLPRKVLKKIEGKTVLEHVIERIKKVQNCSKIILATTDKKQDDILERMAKKLNIPVFRGSEDDVLDRYYQAAKLFKIDPIIRITADCPLIDSRVVERAIDIYLKGNYDYVSNIRPPTFPDGLDVEIFSFKALEKSWKEAGMRSEREHVTSYILKNPRIFKMGNLANNDNISHLRLTLDRNEDILLIRRIYKELYSENPFFGLIDIIKLFKEKPELIKINQHINRNEGYSRSLTEDKIYEK